MKLWRILPLLLWLFFSTQPVLAHSPTGGDPIRGFIHTIGGLPHLIGLVALGIISTKLAGWHRWGILGLFLLSLVIGYSLGWQQPFGRYEAWGMLLSVIGLGLFVAWTHRPPLFGVALMTLLLGMSHGYTHGLAGLHQLLGGWYSLRTLGLTIGVTVMAIILGHLFYQSDHPVRSFGLAGAGMTVAGILLLIAHLAGIGHI